MRPLISIWPYAAVYWAVFICAYAPEALLNRRSRPLLGAQDAGSFRLAMLVQGLATGAGFFIGYSGKFGALAHRHFWFWAGVGTMIAGALLRRHCFSMLGASFTAVVVVKPGQQVIERGAYRWVRHPSYTAGMVLFTGTMLALANWLSVVIALLGAILAYAYRVHVEERALLEILGEPYRAYMARTKRLSPSSSESNASAKPP
ncbi:MAG: methyltransferase family protein [Actinomycetota bacterium]